MSATETALRLLRAKQRSGEMITVLDAWDCCPYRSVINLSGVVVDQPGQVAALIRNAATFALIKDTPQQIDAGVMSDIQQELAAGKTVLLLASNRHVRDTAKACILALA